MITTKDDEIRIHLGANSRPISFEYYTENQGTQQTTSATYYYHYDLHGNVIRVTNSSGTTVIQYTYDQLGTIVSETNSSSIYNPFTYMGEAQVIQDCEFDTSGNTPLTGLYSSGSGYYNPKTGTFLGGSGAPASANPSSTSAEEPTAQSTRPASQLGAHAAISAVGGGVSSTKTAAASVDVEPEPTVTGMPVMEFQGGIRCTLELLIPEPSEPDKKKGMGHDCWVEGSLDYRNGEGYGPKAYRLFQPMPYNSDSPFQALDAANRRFLGSGIASLLHGNQSPNLFDSLPKDVQNQLINEMAKKKHMGGNQAKEYLRENLEFAAWGHKMSTLEYDIAGKKYTVKGDPDESKCNYLMLYKCQNESPVLLYGPGVASFTKANGPGSTYNPFKYTAHEWFFSWFESEGVQMVQMTYHYVSKYGNISLAIFGQCRSPNALEQDCYMLNFENGNIYANMVGFQTYDFSIVPESEQKKNDFGFGSAFGIGNILVSFGQANWNSFYSRFSML